MKTKILIIAIFAVSLLAISSCKKDKTNNNEETEMLIGIQKNEGIITRIYNLITDELNDINIALDAMGYTNTAKPLDSCVQVTIDHPDSTTWPKIITLNFAGGCNSQNGNVLSGRMTINQSDRYRNDGMVRIVTFDNFSINGFGVSGTKTITNIGSANGFKTYSINISNGSITIPYVEQINHINSQRTRVWIEGENTMLRFDDVYLITGTSTGIAENDKLYTATIIEPLRIARNCRWIGQGKISTTVEDLPTVVIDFGNGTCDQTATVTVNGNTRTITLRN